MVKKILIGGAFVVGGYFLYKWLKPKIAGALPTSTSNTVEYSNIAPAEQEKAAWLAQKFNPGFDVGGLAGAFGSSPLLRVIY